MSTSKSIARPHLQIEGDRIKKMVRVAGGGTKTVFDVGGGRVLILPNGNDSPNTAVEKWRKALFEPDNLRKVRDLGLQTSDLRIVNADINGLTVPLLAATNFSDYKGNIILDHKSPQNTPLLRIESPDEALQIVMPVFEELANIVIPHGIPLGYDSFNLIFDPNMRRAQLFIFDFGGTPQYLQYKDVEARKEAMVFFTGALSDALLNCVHRDDLARIDRATCDLFIEYAAQYRIA